MPRASSLEDSEDAIVGGDRAFEPRTARAALRHKTFRTVFVGSFISNVGSWMQNVVLGALAYDLTHSPAFVGIITAAQLGPLLLLASVGGLVADIVDRRRLLIIVSVEQLVVSLVLAVVVAGDNPNRIALLGCVVAIGMAQALYAPAYSAVLPALVPPEHLLGAVSLNSAAMNGSRVIGPAIGGVLFAAVGPSWVFVGNAVSYLFVIGALTAVRLPAVRVDDEGPKGLRRALAGLAVARRDRIVGGALLTVALFSFFSLPFVGQMPVVADDNLGIGPRSSAYGVFYAAFGLGAVVGALSVGTVFERRARRTMTRAGLAGFAVTLAAFSLLRTPGPAYFVIAVVGFFYFVTITSLSAAVQERLDDAVRGRVMALWIMGFGGTVPLGALAAGPIIDHTSVTAVLVAGAVSAAALLVLQA